MKKTKKQLISGLAVLGLLTTTILSPVQTGRAQAAAKIKVNKTKITVSIGKTVTVKAKNIKNNKLKVKISNKKIANVKAVKKNIRITGKKAGAAKITVSAKGMKKCVIKVTVKPAANVTSPVPAATASAAPKASNAPVSSASAAPNPSGTTAAVPSKAPDSKPTDDVDEPKSWDEYLKAGLITVENGILTSCSDIPYPESLLFRKA